MGEVNDLRRVFVENGAGTVTESVTKISPVRTVEAWSKLSAQVRRMQFSAEQRQRRRSPLTILRQTTRVDLDDRQVSLDDGRTRIEARARHLELVQVQERITGDSRKIFNRLIEYSPASAPEAGFYAPVPRSSDLSGPGPMTKNSARSSAAAYQRAGLLPADPPGAQVNLMA